MTREQMVAWMTLEGWIPCLDVDGLGAAAMLPPMCVGESPNNSDGWDMWEDSHPIMDGQCTWEKMTESDVSKAYTAIIAGTKRG